MGWTQPRVAGGLGSAVRTSTGDSRYCTLENAGNLLFFLPKPSSVDVVSDALPPQSCQGDAVVPGSSFLALQRWRKPCESFCSVTASILAGANLPPGREEQVPATNLSMLGQNNCHSLPGEP